jgi:hypothetical protein
MFLSTVKVVDQREGDGVEGGSGSSYRERYRSVFLKSPLWQGLRQHRLRLDAYRCQCCGVASNHNDVHHLYYPLDWNRTLPEHLRTLCRDCHNVIEALTQPASIHSLVEGERRWRAALGCLPDFLALRSTRIFASRQASKLPLPHLRD